MPEKLTPEQRKDLDRKLRKVRVPFTILDHDDVFSDEERNEILRMIKSLFAYAGCIVPPEVILDDGTKVNLKMLVWDLISKTKLTDEEVVAARQLANILDRRADQNERMIAEYDLTEDEAEKLYFQTCGILRAVMELKGLGNKEREDEYARMCRERKVDDAKKLVAFFKRARF